MGTILIVRAVIALVAAMVITFSSNHAAVVGLIVFMGFGFALAGVLMFSIPFVGLHGVAKTTTGIFSISSAVAAGLAAAMMGAGLPALLVVVSTWAAIAAAMELYAGYRSTDKALSREWLSMGVLTAVLAIVMAVVPMNEVYAVGIFGAYAAIIGVFQVIAGISLRTAARYTNEVSS